MPVSFAFKLLLVCALLLGARGLPAAEVLESVAAVRALKPAQVATRLPVRLSGVVTYLRDTAEGVNFILDDGTGGVMVYPKQRPANLQPGQRVTVEGVTQSARLLLSILPTNVVVGAMEKLPSATPATLVDIFSGKCDGRFIELEETVRVVRVESPQLKPQRLSLDLGPRSQRLNVWISHWEGTENRFASGARVRLRGVAVRWHNDRSQPLSTSLLINSPTDTEVLPSAPAPSRQSLADVLLGADGAEDSKPVTSIGVVTYHRPGEVMFIQEGEHALRVRPSPIDAMNAGQSMPATKPGDRVEITGFPVMGDYTTELEDAWVRTVNSPGVPPATTFTDASELLVASGIMDRDARLVSLPATVRDVRERDGRRAVELTSAGHDFTAWLPAEVELPDSLRAGAEVRATGICTLILRHEVRRFGRSPDSFSLLLAGPEALEILRPAPWWTPGRLLTGVAALGLLALLAGVWAAFLRQKNTLLRQEIVTRERAESQLATERRRVAADLHDTLEQTLLAANLQLTAASRLQAADAESTAPLSLAQQLLARGQQEVRDAVWDLHANTAEPQPLAALLARACKEAGSLSNAEVTFTHSGEEKSLTSLIIAQSVRLVREAVTNALKHARPRHVAVACEFTASQLRLTITDDGDGFDTTHAPGPETGHFGLTGMRERLQRLDGVLDIRSAPGQGTTIVATIPVPKP